MQYVAATAGLPTSDETVLRSSRNYHEHRPTMALLKAQPALRKVSKVVPSKALGLLLARTYVTVSKAAVDFSQREKVLEGAEREQRQDNAQTALQKKQYAKNSHAMVDLQAAPGKLTVKIHS